MDAVYPDDGLVGWMTHGIIDGIHYRLFVNNITPDRSTTQSSLTEASWSGYSAVALTVSDFTIQSVVGHIGALQAAPIGFTNSSGSPVTAYGFYVVDDADNKIKQIARFDGAPITIPDGGTYLVYPIFGDFSELSS